VSHDNLAAQLRAARGLLKLSQADRSGSAVVPITAIVDYEEDVATPRPVDLSALRAALEKAGVEFAYGEGVRLSREAILRKFAASPRFKMVKPTGKGYVIAGQSPKATKSPK
jgi:hypothetical protein